jgi:hypothetical protein
MSAGNGSLRHSLFARAEAELARGARAIEEGNAGMGRVCARRAVGAAIEAWLAAEPNPLYGANVMSYLRGLADDASHPDRIRDAALQLQIGARIIDPLNPGADPIEEARGVVEYLRGRLDSPPAR